MVRYAFFASFFATALVAGTVGAAEYHVTPTGSGSACSMAAPCGTVGAAQTLAAAGDTVWIHGGNYSGPSSGLVGVAFSKSGQQNNRINYFAYQNEIPIFNFSNINPTNRVTGFDIRASWIHIRGLEVRGERQYSGGGDSWGVRFQGSAGNNIIERLNVHHNEAPGIFITAGGNNLILNCDSHHNYDVVEGGGSGDGFGCHSSTGGNVLRGCRAWSNSDDGYDFINAPGVCTVEQSWSWSNGWVPDTTMAAGNGAGFKAGGFGSPPTGVPATVPRHVVRQCIAFGNRAQGFYANHHPGGIDFFNNVAFRNPTNYNMLADNGFPSNHTIRNNIAMASGTAISNLTGGTDTSNSWTISGITVNSMDFMSVMESEAGASRQADGSLPNVPFMHLVMGSDLIDKGTNVGLPFSGSAPDLGPFEFGLAPVGGMGGTGGSGMGGRAMGGAAGTAQGGAPGGGAGSAAGGAPGGSAGTASGGAAGASAGTGAVGTAGVGTAGASPSGGTGTGGVATGGVGVGGTAAGGGLPTGGTSTTGGAGGADFVSGDDMTEPAGCGCRVGLRHASDAPLLAASLLALGALFGRRRRSDRPN
jgi:parallel beta-helix repeat protein